MTKNIGLIDRLVRITGAVLIGYIIIDGTLSGIGAFIFGFLALAMLATGIFSSCPLYTPFKLSTRKHKQEFQTR